MIWLIYGLSMNYSCINPEQCLYLYQIRLQLNPKGSKSHAFYKKLRALNCKPQTLLSFHLFLRANFKPPETAISWQY